VLLWTFFIIFLTLSNGYLRKKMVKYPVVVGLSGLSGKFPQLVNSFKRDAGLKATPKRKIDSRMPKIFIQGEIMLKCRY